MCSCFIPECEHADHTSYSKPWIDWAIPQDQSSDQVIGIKADLCDRFPVNLTAWDLYNDTCAINIFDGSRTIRCDQWIFSDKENTIVNEVRIAHSLIN